MAGQSMHRPTIGVVAVLLLGTSAVLWLGGWGSETAGLMSAGFRMGLVMAVLWLAEPQLRGRKPWVLPAVVAVSVMAVLFNKRPLLFFVVLGILLLAAIVRPKKPVARTRKTR